MNTILVVEDDEMLRTLLNRLLTQAGFNVLTAVDGIEGLKMIQTSPPDLVVLDVMMPRMDGLTMLKELRKEKKFDSVRVIMLSSLNESEPKIQSFAHQVDDYLVKTNIDAAEVVEKVKKVLKVY